MPNNQNLAQRQIKRRLKMASPCVPAPLTRPINAAKLKQELLLLHILATTNTTTYSPKNGGFASGQDLLNKIGSDFRTLARPSSTWDWDESKYVYSVTCVDPSKLMASSLMGLKTETDSISNTSFQPAATSVPGWTGGGTHPTIVELANILGM
jgi:hypothetical protein